MSTDQIRHALNGPTMGTRWTALFYALPDFDPVPVQAALQAAVQAVDEQMSTWKPDSALMRLNAAPLNDWTAVPKQMLHVLRLGVAISEVSGGAFDIGMGEAVNAWGFGPEEADSTRIRETMNAPHTPAHEALELDLGLGKVRKNHDITLDLNGIAKGYGVDQLAEVLARFQIDAALVGIDGEMRAIGHRPDGHAWTVAIEDPDPARRAAHSILSLEDASVATSGDYRHWVEVQGRRLSHTMDPKRGSPVLDSAVSVTVVARECALADAWATAFMVMGVKAGAECAKRQGLDVLFLIRDEDGTLRSVAVGRLFGAEPQ